MHNSVKACADEGLVKAIDTATDEFVVMCRLSGLGGWDR